MNTASLEWFGPPERNTLHLLCAVLLKTEELALSPACVCVCAPLRACRVQRALPFYISREARTWPLDPRQVGPTGAVNSSILFIHYGVAGEGDLSPGFPCLFLRSPVQHVQTLSCRNGARRS